MLNILITPSRAHLASFFAVAGPGLVVMLADTDAGSVITAAQSGAQWGYKLLALQLLLIPIHYLVMCFRERACRNIIHETWAMVEMKCCNARSNFQAA